ncbi:hypothetical protein NL108_008692 [Boleophthalmus pectinirostris]|nr:hypothetical protein NL108_008692 [Boleophthalmus pectinirostris]
MSNIKITVLTHFATVPLALLTMQLSSVSLLFLGVSLDLASPGFSEVKLEHGDCPMFWFSFNSRCYKYVIAHVTWADVELYCVSQIFNRASIHTMEVNKFIQTMIQSYCPMQNNTWIGLSDLHNKAAWTWSDGSSVDFEL